MIKEYIENNFEKILSDIVEIIKIKTVKEKLQEMLLLEKLKIWFREDSRDS